MSHYFHPEVGAPQTRILETTQRLAARGHDVTVLTGLPNYPDGVIPAPYRGRLLVRERIGDVNVVRSAVYPAPNRGFARRLLNHASFAISSVIAAPLVPRPDVVIAETPPLFTAASAVAIARGRRAPLVLNVADLWPESAVQLGALSNSTAIRMAEALERFVYRHSAAITVPTAGMRTTLLERGEPPEKVIHLHNAVDVDRFDDQTAPRTEPERVIYCGTVGMAQGVGTLIEAAAELARAGEGLEVLIVGDGAEREQLARDAQARGLTNVRFAGRVDRERVPGLIGTADIAVLCLRDVPLFEDALPTKMLEYLAAGRAVVASAAGDAARLLERSESGIACPPEDPAALAAAIRDLAHDPGRAQQLGENGRRYVRAHFSRDAFVDKLEEIADRLAGDELERARLRGVYDSYARSAGRRRAWSSANPGNQQIISNLYERVGASLIASGNFPRDGRVLLDVGSGYGDLLRWLQTQGAPAEALRGIDVLEERVMAARERVPDASFEVADARAIPLPDAGVDAVVMSTVLSSVIERADRKRIAAEVVRVLRPGGVILCYDIRYWSPRNRAVRPVGLAELARLFPGAEVETQSLTLIPPLARRLGAATSALYAPLASVPPLRTHLFAVIRPAAASDRGGEP